MTPDARRVTLIVLACASPRIAFLFLSPPPDFNVHYWTLSGALLESGTFGFGDGATGVREPLYPAFLAVARWLTGDRTGAILVLQIGVACGGALLLDRLTSRMSGSARAGLVAALCYALYPYLIRQSIAFSEITLWSTLLLGGWLAFARGAYAVSAACLALAALTMAMVLPILIVALVFAAVRAPRRAVVAAAVAFAVLLPWGLRNYRVAGTPLPSRHGEQLYAGNNPYAMALVPDHNMDLFLNAIHDQRGDGPALEEAVAYIRAHPWRTIVAKARNVVYFFHPRLVPFKPAGADSTTVLLPGWQVETLNPRVRSPGAEIVHAVAYMLVAAAAVVGWYRRRRAWRSDILLLASVGVFVATAAVYFPTTRLRAPLDTILMAYAGCAAVRNTRVRTDDQNRSTSP